MRHSQFNRIVPLPGSADVVLYNFRSESCARLDPVRRKFFEFADELPKDNPLALRAKELGFLVEGNELEDLRRSVVGIWDDYAASTHRVLRLTLHITSLCNFACPYCFQGRKSGHMSAEVQDAIVRYVQARLSTGKYERMTVGWFGGEPLVAADILRDLGGRLMEVARNRGAGFSSNIHTNGYLLDQTMVDLLENLNCRFAIITLDGFGEAHDATRHLIGGGPTFQRIIGNLSNIRTHMVLNIRSNMHAGNASTYDGLQARILQIAAETGNEMRCSPVAVHRSGAGIARGDDTEILDDATYRSIKAKTDLDERCRLYDFRRIPCYAMQPDNLVIDDEGYVFPHCNEYAVDQSRAFCNILDYGEASYHEIYEAHRAFALRYTLPEKTPRCMACPLLPTCYGGCPLQRLLGGTGTTCKRSLEAADAYILEKYRKLSANDG